jgi:cytidine deaminase
MRNAQVLRRELANHEVGAMIKLKTGVTNVIEKAHYKGETHANITMLMRQAPNNVKKQFITYAESLGYTIINYSDYRESFCQISW